MRPLQRKRETQGEIKLCGLCGLCVRKIIIARREYISHRIHRIDFSPFGCRPLVHLYYSPLVHQAKAVAYAHQAPQVRLYHPPPPSLRSSSRLSQGDSFAGAVLAVVTTPSARRTGEFPRVALGSAPLKGHKSIFNTFSKGPFRPSQGTDGH